jgi:hypothetical protein
MLRRENLRLNPKRFGQVKFHSTICRARNGSIDRKKRLLELPDLAQAFRRRADEARDQGIELLSAQGPQCAPQQIEAGFRRFADDGKFAFQRDAGAQYSSSEYRPACTISCLMRSLAAMKRRAEIIQFRSASRWFMPRRH